MMLERDRRLDDPHRWCDHVERRERQGQACASVNAVTTMTRLADGAAEQHQADQEQQMLRAGDNVRDAGRQELADDGGRALPRAGEVGELDAAAIENRLGQRLPLVDVQKRLVLRIVGNMIVATVSVPAGDASR